MNTILQACLWMSGAIVSFTVMAVAGRAISLELDTFEIMMYRSAIGVVVVLSVARIFGTHRDIAPTRMHLHFMRNIAHFAGQNLWFYAITVIPLAQVFALEFTSPIWVLLLSPLVLNERLTGNRILAAIVGFIGILIVTRPDPGSLNMGQIAAALAAIGFAGSAVFTRLLTRTDKITNILFWLTAMQFAFGLICAGADGDIALPQIESLPWVILVSLTGLFAHFCLTTALGLAPATVVIPIDFTRLPVVAFVGMLLYDESLDRFVFLGAALIFLANYTNIWLESRRKTVT